MPETRQRAKAHPKQMRQKPARLLAALVFATTLALLGTAAPALAAPAMAGAAAADDKADKGEAEKDSKKKSKKSSDSKKSSKSKSSKSKSSKSKSSKSSKSKSEAKSVLIADIAVAEYSEWIDDGLATKKDNDVVSIRHAISCGDKLIRDLVKQGVAVAKLDDKDAREDAEFTWRYEDICDPKEKKKSTGTGKTTKKKTTKKKVSTADKLSQAEKARIQIEEWIDDGVFKKDDPAIEAVLFTLDCADAMIEYTLDAGRSAIERDAVGEADVIHAHEDICEDER